MEQSFNIQELDSLVADMESEFDNIKPDNQSQFIWIDSLQKTPYALVYLHGFSASHGEAQPILSNFANHFGSNVYLPRLAEHGTTDVDAFTRLTPKALVDSARKAIAVGKSIGDTLIIMSTSTGSTLAAYLAANDPEIHALICTSPNFDLYDSNSHLLVMPWGFQLFRQMMGGNYREWNASDDINKYWTTKNHIKGHIALRHLLNQTMTDETFKAIEQPVYISYYYKDDEHMDKIISIDAIKKFGQLLSTPKASVRIEAFDNARGHVISSMYMNENWEDVQNSIFDFCEDVLQIPAVQDTTQGVITK